MRHAIVCGMRLIQRHDQFFKRLLDQPGAAGALLRERLPPAVAERLSDEPPELLPDSFVDDSLAEQRSDRLYRVTLTGGPQALIHVLVEHKAQADPDLPYQLFGYQARILDRWKPREADQPPPAIFTLVVYHGEAPWRAPLSFAEYLSPDPALRPYLLDFRYQLVDLGPIPDAELSRAEVLRVGLLVLKYGSRVGVDRELLLALGRAALSLSFNEFVVAMRYIIRDYDALSEPLVRDVLAELTPTEEEPVMSIFLETYKAKWLAEGREEGREEGEARGEARGRAQTLLRQMSRRFGPLPEAVHGQVMGATAEQLDRWTDAVLDADSLDALLRA